MKGAATSPQADTEAVDVPLDALSHSIVDVSALFKTSV